ncbi:DUF6265 family protein [Aquimarina algiphila]|uniref:DUF6265 family protein n=1 Tax=Aquimarina algiphila TaxID=2047982 RepID=UPI00232AE298|nr:DUF6265 family protein [Aquimarina algiphila]
MKKTFVLLITILLISCNQNKKEESVISEDTPKLTEEADNFDWLLGTWKINTKEVGKEMFENWDKKSKTEYVGLGFTVQNGDTIKKEKFGLIKLDNHWNFQIQLQGETKPSSFKMTSSNAHEFICENNARNFPNKQLDSPNKIKYRKKGDKIYATISGSKIKIHLELVKLQ